MKLPKFIQDQLNRLKKVRQAPHETDLEVDMTPLVKRIWELTRPKKKPKQPPRF